MGEIVGFFAVFFADAVKRRLQTGHSDGLEQVVGGSQFEGTQGVFFIGGGENNFGLAFGTALDALDKLQTVDFRQADIGEYDICFMYAQPIQCRLGMVEYIKQDDIAFFK